MFMFTFMYEHDVLITYICRYSSPLQVGCTLVCVSRCRHVATDLAELLRPKPFGDGG